MAACLSAAAEMLNVRVVLVACSLNPIYSVSAPHQCNKLRYTLLPFSNSSLNDYISKYSFGFLHVVLCFTSSRVFLNTLSEY